MGNEEPNLRRLPRRELLRIAGVGGLAVAAASVASPFALSALAAGGDDETPEGFLAWAYAQRAQAMTTGNVTILEPIYDPASSTLLAFEKNRASYFYAGLGPAWGGSILAYTSSVSLLSLEVSAAVASARLYESIRFSWIPRVFEVPEQIDQRDPTRFVPTPRGPHGEITSVIGTRHEVTVVRESTGWRLVKDAYDEADLGFISPDLLPGSWAVGYSGTLAGGVTIVGAAPGSTAPGRTNPLTTYQWNWPNAVAYAGQHCQNYNSTYCNYSVCGQSGAGDCANFVSQCLRAGNQVPDRNNYWTAYYETCSYGCAAQGTKNDGTVDWVNVNNLWGWVLTNGRGVSESWITNIGMGDLVVYDQSNSGSWNHIAMVTGMNPYLVSCHTSDRCNAAWNYNNAARYGFIWVNNSYTV